MVFPHHRTVFGFDALHSHARPHDFRQAVDVQRVDAPTLFDVFTHLTRPGLRTEYAYAQRAFAGVHALAFHFFQDIAEVGRRDHDDVGPEILDQLHLLLGLAAGHRHHGTPQPFRDRKSTRLNSSH